MAGQPIIEVRPAHRGPLLVVVSRRLELGRECDGLLLDDPLLSRRHLALTPFDGGVQVEDLGSSNGTLLDGTPLLGRTVLRPGSSLRAGDTEVRLTGLVAAAPPLGRPPTGDAGSRNALQATVSRESLGALLDQGEGTDLTRTAVRAVARIAVTDPALAERVAEAPRTGATVTFLFSDIEASTSRTQAIGDRAWYGFLTAHNQVVEQQIAAHRGTVVKSIGDGYMATFESAVAASMAAIAIQRALAARPIGPAEDPVRVRIGLHTGEAITVDGDLFGLHVNMAARVADRARGGQILVSSLTRAVVEVSGDVRFAASQTVQLKGLAGDHEVSEIDWAPLTSAPSGA